MLRTIGDYPRDEAQLFNTATDVHPMMHTNGTINPGWEEGPPCATCRSPTVYPLGCPVAIRSFYLSHGTTGRILRAETYQP